jgi:GNAT superfamily N-acetyltransferase
VPELYSVRDGKREEQRDLTRLCVRATIHAGYNDAFVDRAMPVLTVTIPLITAGCVRVAEDKSGTVVGVIAVTTTIHQGIALLHSIYVDPPSWKRGVGRALFGAAVRRAKELKAGAMLIYAFPSAEGFYKRMGAIRIGEGPFFYSPDVIQPQFLYLIPRET